MSATLAKPTRDRVFLARRDGLRLVVKRAQERKDWEGNILETIRGEHLRFEKGKLVVPPAGQMKGENGEPLDAQEITTFLLGDAEKGQLPHPLLGDREEGFWLHEEPAPAPSEEERDLLSSLSMDLDVPGLEAFIREEAKGWNRPELLRDGRRAIERARAKLEERASTEAAKPAPKPRS